jgi:thiol-disulfide isomerase/thioredoxin
VLLWSSGAEWCGICKAQAPRLNQISAEKQSQGLLVFESLHQNAQGGPADAATLSRWKDAFNLTYELFIEKTPNYAGHADNPLDLIIDGKTMKVRYRQVHTSADLSVYLDAALKAAGN